MMFVSLLYFVVAWAFLFICESLISFVILVILICFLFFFFFFSSRRRHTRLQDDWSSDVCSSDLLGRQAEFEAAFAKLREHGAKDDPVSIAAVYAWTGEADAAFEWLEKSTPPNRLDAIFYLREPTFAKLHTDPRWHAYLERLGLAPEQLAAIKFKIKLPKSASGKN